MAVKKQAIRHPRGVTEKAEEKRKLAMAAFAKSLSGFHPASDVLEVVTAVPTIFSQFDYATRVGGWPLKRFSMIHGPSSSGKTRFVIGLFGGFLMRPQDRVLFLDLERTTPITWVEELLGKELANSKRFLAEKPDTIEAARDILKRFLAPYIALREAGGGEDMTAFVMIDSIAKLVPKDQFDATLKEKLGDGGIDGMKGRGDMRRAALVKSWLNEVVPDLEKSGATMGVIARETQDMNADFWDKKYGNDFKVGGGVHVFYDSSLVIRVELEGEVVDDRNDERKVLGERHRVTIRKSKVSAKEGKSTICHFHTSNGTCAPLGFDPTRDLIELGVKLGVIESSFDGDPKKASPARGKRRLLWGEHKFMNVHDTVRLISRSPALLEELDKRVRAAFQVCEPDEAEELVEEVERV